MQQLQHQDKTQLSYTWHLCAKGSNEISRMSAKGNCRPVDDATYIADVRDGIEDDGGQDERWRSEKHGVDSVVAKSLDNRRKEVDSRTHSLSHAHAPDESPDLGIKKRLLESAQGRGVLVGLAVSGLLLQAPDGKVALHGLQKTSIVREFGHHEREDHTASNGDNTLTV